MTEPYMTNGLLLGFAEVLYGDQADADAAEQAFNSTDGTFLERITAAINALVQPHLKPERFIEIPENPQEMTRADLEALVRPVAEGFLRSHPTKDELLFQVRQISRRQASRPSWMPRTEDSTITETGPESSEEPSRPVSVTLSGFPELGEVTVAVPAYYGDLMYPADSTHPAVLQLALLTIFGAIDASAAGRTIRGDEAALDALIPVERRWWAPTEETLSPRSAAEDAGVAVEALATSQRLGGMPVQDIAGPEAAELAADVLLSAGSWKHGPRIVVDGSQPVDGSRERSVARASFAGWANDANEGFVVAVTSGGWDDDANVYPLGHRLHTSILWWTAPKAGVTEGAGTMHRIMLHCPGEDACQRDGCNDTLDDAVLAAIGLVADDVAVTAPIAAGADWAAEAYRASLLGTGYDEPEDVLSVVTQPLMAAGWEEISSSSSELGDTEVLLSRGQQVLAAAYRPLTREVVLADGRPELDMVCQMLADDSVLVEDSGGVIRVDRAAGASADWSNTLLTVIEKHLVGELTDDSALAKSIHILLAGIWPWGTGVPHSDHDWDLLHRQVMMQLRRTALLGN